MPDKDRTVITKTFSNKLSLIHLNICIYIYIYIYNDYKQIYGIHQFIFNISIDVRLPYEEYTIQCNTIQYNIRLLTIADMPQLSLQIHSYSNIT